VNAPVDLLREVSPREALLVIPCSRAKAEGGESAAHPARDWPEPLLRARAALSDRAQLDESRLLPAYRRYIGGFYQEAGTAITAAVDSGAPLIVISGGYGVIRGDELIGTYDRQLHIGDWPPGLLESLLVSEVGRLGVRSVVAFSAATSQYHLPVRRARWHAASAVERVLLVSAAGPGGGAQHFVPRTLGRAFRAFWFREPADAYPPTVTVESLHAATRTGTEAAQIAQLAELLSDPTRAEPPATFPKDPAAADRPGLYAWWGDQEAVRVISDVLGSRVGNLLYVGQAGATSSVAGKRSNATLLSRIRGQHIRAQTRASTFARTIAAVLREPMQLDLAAPGLLTEHSRQQLSSWICEHLQVAAVPVPAPDALTTIEDAVLAALNPPLNLDGMPRTPQRHRLSELRSRLGHPASSASPDVSRGPPSRSSPAPGTQPPGVGFDEVWDRIRRGAGEKFTPARGQQFSYEVIGNNVLPVGRQRQLHKGNFARAHARMPLRATTDIKDVQGSSYVFAILTDQRICGPLR
jgi:GIY-YIG catalytic domain-containing protein